MGLEGWFDKAKAWVLASDLTKTAEKHKIELKEITRAPYRDDYAREQFYKLFVANYERTKEFIQQHPDLEELFLEATEDD